MRRLWKRARGVPVLAVHGFDGYGGKDVSELASLSALGFLPVGYYSQDRGFPVSLPGGATTDTSLDVLGARLAAHLLSLPKPVDLIGHSMGGLLISAALRRIPTAAVRRVVMLGVPFAGLPSAAGADVAQCREMTPGSAWLRAAAAAGWRADLTIASAADEAVPVDSALACGVGRTILVAAHRGVHHGDLVTDPTVIEAVRAFLND